MYFEDRGLTIFTLYKYRLTVKNDYGQTTSQPSDEVATFGDVPRKAADVSVFSVNHTAIDIRWITPGGCLSRCVINENKFKLTIQRLSSV